MRQHIKKDFELTTETQRHRVFDLISASLCLCGFLVCLLSCTAQHDSQKIYSVRGVVREVDAPEKYVIVQHEKIPGYMDAMTMPFDVKNTNELRGLTPGDRIAFQLATGPDTRLRCPAAH